MNTYIPSAAANLVATESEVFRKIACRVLPLLTLGFIVNFLDRTNVAFAALTMNRDIGLSPAAFGYGAGMLFLGYCLFEVPSNIALYRFGARIWISRILISWGIISMAMIYTAGPKSFYLLRFLLGVAEAGYFPGVAYYLTQWFPAEYRARIYAWFLVGIPASTLIGGPLASFLFKLNSVAGLAGWKWLFLIEGAPALILGIIVLLLLVDSPERADWLTAEEKETVNHRLRGEKKERERHHLWASLKDNRVLLLALIQFTYTVGSYGVAIFLPLIIKQRQFTDFTVGFLTAFPSLIACIVMVLWAGSVDRSGRKIFNLALTCLISAFGLVVSTWAHSFIISLAGLTLAVVGTNTARAILWTIPTRFLSGVGAAGGLAFINSVGTVGGFIGPSVMGFLKTTTGSFTAGLMAMSCFLFVATALVLTLKFVISNE